MRCWTTSTSPVILLDNKLILMKIQRTIELPTVRRSTRVHFEQSVATISPSERYHMHIHQNHIYGKNVLAYINLGTWKKQQTVENLLSYPQQEASILQRGLVWMRPWTRQRSWPQADEIDCLDALPGTGKFPGRHPNMPRMHRFHPTAVLPCWSQFLTTESNDPIIASA